MSKDNDLKLIVVNPPTEEYIKIKLKELSSFLSKNWSKRDSSFLLNKIKKHNK